LNMIVSGAAFFSERKTIPLSLLRSNA